MNQIYYQHGDELYHYGRKGQKWGEHIYGKERPSGSRPRATANSPKKIIYNGKRYVLVKKKKKSKVNLNDIPDQPKRSGLFGKNKNKQISNTEQNKPENKPKKISDLSNAELKEKISRIKMEQEYVDLTTPASKKRVDRGKKFVADVLENSAKNIATQTVTYLMGKGVNKALGNIFDDPNIINPKKGQKDK